MNVFEVFFIRRNITGSKADLVDKNYIKERFNGTNYKEVRNLTIYYKILDETFQTLTVKMLTLSRGYLNEKLEKFILEAHQHGILIYFQRRTVKYEYFQSKFESEPKILTMYMLSAGFYIWLGTVGIACIAFVGEFIMFEIEVRFSRD